MVVMSLEYRDGVLYRAGVAAGNINADGYCHIKLGGKTHKRHRLVWEMFKGPIPAGEEIDHINGVKGDDRIENLQLLSRRRNTMKGVIERGLSKSGVPGVTWSKTLRKWRAYINHGNKQTALGVFDNFVDAVAARKSAEAESEGLVPESYIGAVPYVTNIPALIEMFGSMAQCCRGTGLSELTIAKYRYDTGCEKHVIYNGRLMTHQKTSPVLYSRRGVTKTERANGSY